MKAWNSTLKRGSSQLKRSPFKRATPKTKSTRAERGLAQRIAESLDAAIRHAKRQSALLRSESHRRNVAALPCAACGKQGQSQCAHANATKGMGIKVCDSLTFPLCHECHMDHDQGGHLTRNQRWKKEWEHADYTRAELIRKNLWNESIEKHYQRAIEPLKRMLSK